MPSKYTKAKSISLKTKYEVYDRQHGLSLLSGKPITLAQCCCHYLNRGRGGVGFCWNIMALTTDEHRKFDLHQDIDGMSHEECCRIIEEHFKQHYVDWSIERCKYKKYCDDEEDYKMLRTY